MSFLSPVSSPRFSSRIRKNYSNVTSQWIAAPRSSLGQAGVNINPLFKFPKFKKSKSVSSTTGVHFSRSFRLCPQLSPPAPPAVCQSMQTRSLVNPKHRHLSLHASLLIQFTAQQALLFAWYLHKKVSKRHQDKRGQGKDLWMELSVITDRSRLAVTQSGHTPNSHNLAFITDWFSFITGNCSYFSVVWTLSTIFLGKATNIVFIFSYISYALGNWTQFLKYLRWKSMFMLSCAIFLTTALWLPR